MPTGSFDLSPVPGGQAVQALPIYVALYEPGGENPYTILPNIFCLRIDYREGPEPPLARFQYMMGDLLQSAVGWPSQFERLWPIDAQGDYVVMTDDRLVVLTQIPSGTADGDPQTVVLFDGFAQVPQADVSAGSQAVTFVAQGVAIRLWDSPITGRTQRDADRTGTTDGSADGVVQLPCRFNPSDDSIGAQGGYIGNCVPSGEETEIEDSEDTFPVFLDPLVGERGDFGVDTSYWFVSDALTYLIETEPSAEDEGGAAYVLYPPIGTLNDILSCESPPDNGLLNDGDAQSSDIKIRDYDASNKAVPDVFAELLRYCGFVMVFYTDTYTDGTPETHLKIVRRDGLSAAAPKLLCLSAAGSSSLNLGSNNTTALHLARDCNEIVNQWTVETALKQVEVSVYLAPLFTPDSGDAADRSPFFLANLTNASSHQRRMYRWWGADECGDGHWNADTSTWVTGNGIDLSPAFPPDDDGNTTYVVRYRPGSNTLISKDADGKPLKAVLEISQGYSSGDPDLEDGSGAGGWITIPHGHGWRLLDDRLGIEVTANDPDEWVTGSNKSPDGMLKAIPKIQALTWTATPTDATKFLLRLTTVIEADQRIRAEPIPGVLAEKRKASPTKFVRERSIDGRDHFQHCEILKGSLYYDTQKDPNGEMANGTDNLVCRDDTAAAKTHAEQLRAAHEFPTLAGSATVPFLTDYYQIGDRVKIVQGRNASLQINVGIDQGEAPTYPWITAFAWDFAGDKQQTILQFSDRRAEPQGV